MGLINIRVDDGAAVAAVFRRLTPELQRAALEAALFRSAGAFQKAVKAAAPVGTEPTRKTRRIRSIWVGRGRKRQRLRLPQPVAVSYDYGHLRDDIRRRRLRGGPVPVVRVSTGAAFWAAFLERGTKRMKPHPFYQRAVDGAVTAARLAFADSFGKSVETAALRLSSEVSRTARTRLRG